jgi:tetratricopeptide (TPR) repeat protein
MKALPRIFVVLGIIVLGALNVSIYWNNTLYRKALKAEDKRERIRLLDRANGLCPINELVLYEIGKSYFELGLEDLAQPEVSRRDFQRAVQYLRQSVQVNPASPYAHFYLGQSLLRLGASPASKEIEAYGELRKAIALGGNDSRISFEVGQLFFSRWPQLSPDDRDLTLKILKQVLARGDPAQAVVVMSIWEMNVADPTVMIKILPADASIYRLYAGFLGERSLFLQERQQVLAQAERLDFVSAQREYQRSQVALFRSRFQEGRDALQSGLNLLQGIRFYQKLANQDLIDLDEFTDLLRSISLGLATCRMAGGEAFEGFEHDLLRYLALEDRPKEISGLENLLESRGFIEAKLGSKFDDMRRLAFEMLLYFKQMRYSEIVEVGRKLSHSVAIVPGDEKREYAEVLRLIGDSYQKIDYLYDAGDLYQKALEMYPGDIETLLHIRQNYDRLNEDKKVRDIDSVIGKLETPREIVAAALRLERGGAFNRRLVFGRRKVTFDFLFAPVGKNWPAAGSLIAINLNGRVVREDFVKEGLLSLDVETDAGENDLQILPVNGPVVLTKLSWRPNSDVGNTPNPRSLH